MSRRSLRLDDGLLDRSLPLSSASFTGGGTSWRNNWSLKSRRTQHLSSSCSESLLLLTPPLAPASSSRKTSLNSSLHSVASDASLLSSILDDSSLQESTMIDSLWGLDQDLDHKESTVIEEPSTIMADRTLIGLDPPTVIGRDERCGKHQVQKLGGSHCRDCELLSERRDSLTTHCPLQDATPQSSTIYTRDRGHKSKIPGVFVSAHRRLLHLLTLLHLHLLLLHKHLTARATSMKLKKTTTSQNASSLISHLLQLCITAASSLWPLTCHVFTASVSAGRSAGKTAAKLCSGLDRRWRHMTDTFLWFRFPLLLLLALLLLLSVSWYSSAALQLFLPTVNITELMVITFPGQSAESAKEVQPYEEQASRQPPLLVEEVQPNEEQASRRPSPLGEEEEGVEEGMRLLHLEQSVTVLWEQVEAGGRRAELRYKELLRLFADLQQEQKEEGGEEPKLRGLQELALNEQVEQLVRRLEEEQRRQEDQTRLQNLFQQKSQTSRLDQLELQLQSLAARMEEVMRRQEAAVTTTLAPAASVGVDRESHDALLAEVSRLEVGLKEVRRDVEEVSRCKDTCGGVDSVQLSELVSAQVREELRSLLHGNQLVARGGASDNTSLKQPLLHWLSEHYVSREDLQEALSSLQHSILQDISLQLEQHRQEEGVREGALLVTGAAVTQEDVHSMVKDALRLFSEDRTGRADYALESGGGSILSTRCSETYETKAALLSLFGLPLWYFSQSPRAVIQPDVNPGNCWAFRGSTGFLVIRLSVRIRPTAFSLEHLPRALAPSGKLQSAPRNFSVYGLEDESQEKGTLLGTYTYEEDGDALQTFNVSEDNEQDFQIMELQVLSNWGHPEYTCIYRFRVHGTPTDT